MNPARSRSIYAILLALVILVGGASRLPIAENWPPFIVTYAGDTLWALMLFLGLGFVFPRIRTRTAALIVLPFAYLIEILQLYQAPWMETLRETVFGKLVLGSGFLGSDFVCYTVGCLAGVAGEMIWQSRCRDKFLSPEVKD